MDGKDGWTQAVAAEEVKVARAKERERGKSHNPYFNRWRGYFCRLICPASPQPPSFYVLSLTGYIYLHFVCGVSMLHRASYFCPQPSSLHVLGPRRERLTD